MSSVDYARNVDTLGNLCVLPAIAEVMAKIHIITKSLQEPKNQPDFAEVYWKILINDDDIINHAIQAGYDSVEQMVEEAQKEGEQNEKI